VQSQRVVEVAGEGVETIESAGGGVVVPRAEVLEAGGVGLLARVEQRSQGGGQVQTDAEGVVAEDLRAAGVDDLAGGIQEGSGRAVAVVEERDRRAVHNRRGLLGDDILAERVGLRDLAGVVRIDLLVGVDVLLFLQNLGVAARVLVVHQVHGPLDAVLGVVKIAVVVGVDLFRLGNADARAVVLVLRLPVRVAVGVRVELDRDQAALQVVLAGGSSSSVAPSKTLLEVCCVARLPVP